jgi:predicted methyltransferase
MASLLKAVKEVGADYFYVDRLNRRFGVWSSVQSLLNEHFPYLIAKYRRILFEENASREYSERLMVSVNSFARKQGLNDKMRLCF